MLREKSSVAERQLRKLSAEFKAKAALAALRQDKTLAKLCAEFQVHSTQITEWKRLRVERAAVAFVGGAGADIQPAVDMWFRCTQRPVLSLSKRVDELTLETTPAFAVASFLERALTKAGLLSARG
ncbi:MAG: hypothetical protein EAZ30_16550 [Betaproteobacteria bacterium]|nr:MAG: hypothetical protein EAZ43_11880 [Betaproteobacteria bacterium]TAG44969.1 MAG: hypothetical protein EAZ30_16550 [Betaproteobacteria bacterium]